MKKWVILVGLIVVLFIGGYFLLSFYAVKFLQAQLPKAIGPGFTLAEIKVKSTYLSVHGIQYEDPRLKQRFFQIEEVRIYPEILFFLKGTLRIREFTMLQPSFFFHQSREGGLIGPGILLKKMEKEREHKRREGKEEEPIPINVDRIRIEKGSVNFEDREVNEPPGQIKLRELDLDIKNIQFPIISAHSQFELKGKTKGPKKEGSIYMKGWVDLKTMDMEASFKVREIEVKIFEPYYRKKVSAEVKGGHVNMEAEIAVQKKMIDVPGQLELIDLGIREGGTVFWIPAKTLVSLLKR